MVQDRPALVPTNLPCDCDCSFLPDSNGLQERTFSASTWMDGKLNKKQSEFTFNSKVLLYKNQGLLEKYKEAVEKEIRASQKQEAAARTERALKVSAMLRSVDDDDDLDEETEFMVDAYFEDAVMKENARRKEAAAKKAAISVPEESDEED